MILQEIKKCLSSTHRLLYILANKKKNSLRHSWDLFWNSRDTCEITRVIYLDEKSNSISQEKTPLNLTISSKQLISEMRSYKFIWISHHFAKRANCQGSVLEWWKPLYSQCHVIVVYKKTTEILKRSHLIFFLFFLHSFTLFGVTLSYSRIP